LLRVPNPTLLGIPTSCTSTLKMAILNIARSTFFPIRNGDLGDIDFLPLAMDVLRRRAGKAQSSRNRLTVSTVEMLTVVRFALLSSLPIMCRARGFLVGVDRCSGTI